jgi:hypothetical protein
MGGIICISGKIAFMGRAVAYTSGNTACDTIDDNLDQILSETEK